MPAERRDDRMARIEALQQHTTGMGGASGAAGDLREQLMRAFGGTRIAVANPSLPS